MESYYNKYIKPGHAQVQRTSSVNYFTDDERKKKKFDPLLPQDFDYNKYKFTNVHNEEPDYLGGSNDGARNKEIRNAYPSANKYYDPYDGIYQPNYKASEPQPISHIPIEPMYQPVSVPQPAYYQHPAYAVPKYGDEYSAPSKRHFLENNSHRKLQEAQNNYYARKRGIQGTAYSDRSLAENPEYLNSRQRQRKGKFEDFIKYTAPRLQYKKIVLMQALFRGAYVRKRIFPQIVQFHAASVRTVDAMIDHYIEDVFIPDLLLELLAKNKVYENFDLYSDENKVLYEIRASIMERVIRDMVKDIVKTSSDNIVNRYLNKRFRQKDVDERDPLSMVVASIMNGVMKDQAKEIAANSIKNLSLDYLIQSQFYSLLNRVWIPREIEHTIIDSIEDIALEDVVNNALDRIIMDEAPRIAEDALAAEKQKQEAIMLEHAFSEYVDRVILESWINNLSRLYEDEESKIHIKEQQEKAIRDHARLKTNKVKEEFRELNKELEANKEDQLNRSMSKTKTPVGKK